MATSLWKTKRERLIAFIFVNTIQHLRILKNRIDHSSEPGPPSFFHPHTKTVLGRILIHFVNKAHVLVATVELIWLLFLDIFSFNFVQTLNRSLRFRRFKRNYVNHPVVVPSTVSIALLFLLMCNVQSGQVTFFCSCLSPIIVQLCNLLLLNTSARRMLLTPRWVSLRKDVE